MPTLSTGKSAVYRARRLIRETGTVGPVAEAILGLAHDFDRVDRAAHRDEIAARSAVYHAAHRDEGSARKAVYRSAHPEKSAASVARVRAHRAAHAFELNERRRAQYAAKRLLN
jgi:hypothetical protein